MVNVCNTQVKETFDAAIVKVERNEGTAIYVSQAEISYLWGVNLQSCEL